jgi:hypothetical protein
MTAATRPSAKFFLSDVELAMAKQATAFGLTLLDSMRNERARATATLKDALARPDALKTDGEGAARKEPLEALESLARLPEQGEVFGRALAFITGIDPDALGQAFVDADVQLSIVRHGTPIPERLVRQEAILCDPFGQPLGKAQGSS